MTIPVNRQYQNETVDGVCNAARRGAHVIVMQGPTGCGKTNIICGLNQGAFDKSSQVLNVVHRRKLVDQMSARLSEFEIPHGVIMRERSINRMAVIQVASRDTLLSRCVQQRYMDLPPAQLVIVDEGRHAISPEMRGLLRHYEDRGAYIVLADATPVTPEGNGLGPWAQAIVIAAKVTDLVRQGYLVPVKCFAPDRKMHRGKARRGIAGDLVESWQRYSAQLPTVLFTSRVQHSIDAVEAFNEAGIKATHVDANTSDDERDAAFEGLEAGTVKVVSNVGIIKEGVDVPCLGCCQLYMDIPGRVAFLQACGRIMRPYPGKTHGVLIDHAGAVFRHGFPDEDTDWPLEGNVDAEFNQKHKDGMTEKAFYCKHCELLYHGQPGCPQCGKVPTKPPRSIFAAPPLENTNEILTEAQRGGGKTVYEREEKVKHWLRCLAVAANRNGTFGMAGAIFKKKYNEFPGRDFPCIPANWGLKVLDVYPKFKRGGGQ